MFRYVSIFHAGIFAHDLSTGKIMVAGEAEDISDAFDEVFLIP